MTDRCSRVLHAVHGVIERELHALRREAARPLSLLDVGCWEGDTTLRFRDVLGGAALGIEVFAEQASVSRTRGIDVAEVDLESQRFPWRDGSVDVVVANQVFEHLKNVWLPIAEIARVLAPGGHLIFSVPNLASLHNRVLLALGRQPSSIRTFGPHVRGYTCRQAAEFLELGDFLTVRRVVGVGFYPFPTGLATPLARAWTGASHTPVFVARRVAAAGVTPPWAALLEQGREQTWYGSVEPRAERVGPR